MNTVTLNVWEAEGKFTPDVYNELVDQFGVERITPELLERFEKITGYEPHILLRRNLFFAHRGLNDILDDVEKRIPVFIYTGRGPSGEIHIGHTVVMDFTVWLQKVLHAVVVFQIADDEKYWFKNKKWNEIYNLGKSNAISIIALGFDPAKTFIFSNRDFSRTPDYQRVCADILNVININTVKKIFGLTDNCSGGQLLWPYYQTTASFSQAFGPLFRGENVRCLVAYAIDQDPYFRMARDVAKKLKFYKPCSIICQFLPALEGNAKMSTTHGQNKTIFMSDTPKQIAKKIRKYGFSGGQETIEEHRKIGGRTDVDVAFQWLRYFLKDDEKLINIKNQYESGEMLASDLKAICIEVVTKIVLNHQLACRNVTPNIVESFYTLDDKFNE